jgi:Big-like domain-containing protein
VRGLFAPRTSPRSLKPLAWVALPVFGLAVGVLASGVGIDLLLVAVSGLIMLTLERTLGDWMSEKFGPVPATIGFSLILAGLTWYVIASSDRFLDAAEERGYRGVYYRTATASAASVDSDSTTGSGPAPATHGGHGESTGSTPTISAAVESVSGPAAADEPQPSSVATGSPAQAIATSTTSTSPASQPGLMTRIVSGGRQPPPVGARTVVGLSIAPATISPGRKVRIQASVASEGHPVAEGAIEFVIDGVAFRRVAVDGHGVAATEYSSAYPGAYDVQARFPGTYRFQSSLSNVHTLKVTPH